MPATKAPMRSMLRALLALLLAVHAAASAARAQEGAAPQSSDGDGDDGDGDANEGAPADAETASEAEPAEQGDKPAETIVGRRRDQRRIVGSAHTIDQEQLERFEVDDVQRALRTVPGVYVRDEDGQGLRPNIGLRGASSDRSAKVALLEDGVLFAPAPYSAPAAYYFPLTARLVGIEVFKGPAAIRQGPHTVGGALNLRTRGAPYAPLASLDVGVGLVGPGRDQHRLHGYAGAGDEHWGVLVEGARVASEGFKRLDGDADVTTGFLRDDVMLKGRIGSGLADDVRHTLEVKLGAQREESDETYLGLTDADFRQDALRRYASSQHDHMSWTRTQIQGRYALGVRDFLDVDLVAYRHDLARVWNKVNGVRGAPNLHDVLRYPDAGANPIFLSRLRDGEDALLGDGVDVMVGPNDRRFFSHGVAALAKWRFALGPPEWAVEQQLEIGARLHQDGVERRHTERGFSLVRSSLIDLGEDDALTADNEASAVALALHVADDVRFLDLVVVPGVRVELVRGSFVDHREGGAPIESDQVAILPGLGVAYQPLRELVFVGGIHRGFSPVAPGQAQEVRPEQSTNGEIGVRVDVRRMVGATVELIGFGSLYENILAECTFSSGCVDDVGRQQNGGAATITGLELLARHEVALRPLRAARLKTEASYTFTSAVFSTSFDSSHPLFGRVRAGDEMTYVPAHQAAFLAGVILGDLDVGASLGLASPMRDVPGQGEPTQAERTDAISVIDLSASYAVLPGVRLTLRVDNALDQRAIVSRRPFGARPGKPRTFMAGLELDWGS